MMLPPERGVRFSARLDVREGPVGETLPVIAGKGGKVPVGGGGGVALIN